MRRIILLLCFVPILVCLIGCESPLVQAVFQEQEWSENYALADGVICTSPEMIDGDINTIGRAAFPERISGRTVYGAFPNAEVEITLPEKKSIHKIVIHSENLGSFKVLASDMATQDWKIIEEVDKSDLKDFVIRTSLVTDKIMIRARGLASSAGDGNINTVRVAEPEIKEIELYGFAGN